MLLPPRLIRQLRRIVGIEQVDTGEAELLVYESDGLTLRSARPECVVYPANTGECAEVVMACRAAGVPFVPRGAGTGLSGGAISDGGVIIQLSRMNRLLAIHPEDRYAVVQPGVVNNYLSLQTRPYGLEFAPDPSSQAACTIGGNLAENSGGPHTLKYGVTANHILGQTVVFPDGKVAAFGGPYPVRTGPDFSAFLTGTEGTIAITTEIIVRLVPVAPALTTMLAIYSTVADATDSASAILAARVLPTAMELIDNLCIQAVEAHLKVGFPTDAAAVLLIELDGDEELMKADARAVARACKDQGAVAFHTATTDEERQRLWLGRKHAIGALGKITPAFYTNDGVVPRSRLTNILQTSYRIAEKHHLRVAHVCHAGDGNIHPLILYDPDEPQGPQKAMDCSEDILLACLEMGGTITGEHGIGVEKRTLLARMFSRDDLDHMIRLRDGFNPDGLLNPGKIFPDRTVCGEVFATGSLGVNMVKSAASTWPQPGGPVQPQDRQQLGELLVQARSQGVTVGPPGATYRWDLSRLNRVVSFNPPDMVLSVETGITLQAIKKTAEGQHLWLPLDVPGSGELTLARYLAGDYSLSWLSHRYGTARDWVMSLTAADDHGRQVTSGAPLVKNVAGYQLAPLYIGAEDAFGPVVEVSFRLLPLPAALTLVRFQAGHVAPLLQILNAARQASHPSGKGDPWEAVRLERREGVWHLDGLTRFDPDTAARWGRTGEGEETISKVQTPPLEAEMSVSTPALRLHVLPTRIYGMLEDLQDLEIDLVCYPDAGVIHFDLGTATNRGEALNGAVFEATAMGGQIQPLREDLGDHFASNAGPSTERIILERVKTMLDPNGVFGPLPATLC